MKIDADGWSLDLIDRLNAYLTQLNVRIRQDRLKRVIEMRPVSVELV